MTYRKIKLNAVEDVETLVKAAERCSYDVDVYYNSITVDATSLIGLLSMDLRHVLTVKYAVEDDQVLAPVLDQFAA